MLPLKSKILLFPYWAALKIRHLLYDKGIMKSSSFPVPVICIGNITVGGTGKTPHTEMIIRMLQDKYRVAVLSRGYKRKTKGFRIATLSDTFAEIGDEPLQIKHKFPHITVAVCEDRCFGIEKLLELPVPHNNAAAGGAGAGVADAAGGAGVADVAGGAGVTDVTGTAGTVGDSAPVDKANIASAPQDAHYRPEIIILDDAFQHRRVKPSHSIVLMNWQNPIFTDNLLPLGRLRDLPEQICRANSVIVTKSPLFGEHDGIIDEPLAAEQIAPIEKEWRARLNLRPEQNLCFSYITYGNPKAVFPFEGDNRYIYSKSAIFFTGIANDSQFKEHIADTYKILGSLKFPDHYNFSQANIRDINSWAAKHPTSVVLTTEKDSMRLMSNPHISADLKKRLFYIPIEVRLLPSQTVQL